MTATELESIVKEGLTKAGLLAFLDPIRTQFLDVSDGMFVELVLTDASKLSEFEAFFAVVRNEFPASQIEIDSIIRAVWRVKSVKYVGPARTETGGLRAARAYRAVLESGNRTCEVSVALTYAATDFLEDQLRKAGRISDMNRQDAEEVIRATSESVVRQFLELELSAAGTSYWDPIRYPHQELNEAAIMYALARTKTFRALQEVINETFNADPKNLLLHDFLNSLSNARIPARDFKNALLCLPAVFGGAYGRGQEFETSAAGAYAKLDDKEKRLIEAHFMERLAELEKSRPELKGAFPAVFRG